MDFKRTKILATVAVAALIGIPFSISQSQAAAVNPTVSVSMTTNSAVTVADGVDMNFGTWFLVFRNADPFDLRLTTAGTVSAINLGGGTGDSQAIETLAAAQAGTVTVSLPTGINGVVVNLQRTAITPFTDPGLTLQNITYGTTTQGANQALAEATNRPVTIVTGGTPETVRFGADIHVTATPADAAHTASFNVSFAY